MTMERIDIGSLQCPYKEFSITVPANGDYRLNYLHSSIEILQASSSNYTVSFEGSAETTLQVGIGYQYQNAPSGNRGALSFVTFINRTNAAITLLVALGAGDINDHRQIGAVTVSGQEDNPVWTRHQRPTSTIADVINVSAGDSGTWTPPDTTIKWAFQNNTSGNVTLYGGIVVPAGGFFRSDSLAAVSYSAVASGSLTFIRDYV